MCSSRLTCPQCSHHWHAPLDIVSFVWSEIHAWAVRLLHDVHALALAYGWRGVGHSRDESVAASGVPRVDRTMSDYLGNLIARTVSPAVAVRPQLPSLFEPAPATREAKSGPEFEQENFVEQPPVTLPSEKLAPMPLSIPTPRQSVFREPEQTVPEISRARRILETSQESDQRPAP